MIVAASDYLKVLPGSLDRWMPRRVRSLGTDGFGRSEDRADLRELLRSGRALRRRGDARRARAGRADSIASVVAQAIKDFGIDAEKPNPATVFKLIRHRTADS